MWRTGLYSSYHRRELYHVVCKNGISWYELLLSLILVCTLQCSISHTLIIIYKVTKSTCISVFVFQTSSSGSISSPIHKLVTDGYTLQVWEFGQMKTMFPRLETVIVNIFESLPADVVKILPDTIAELCLQKVTYGSYGTIRKYNSLCGILIEHFRQLVKLTFIDLRIGNTDAESILVSLSSLEHLTSVRYVYLDGSSHSVVNCWIHFYDKVLGYKFSYINNFQVGMNLQKSQFRAKRASITPVTCTTEKLFQSIDQCYAGNFRSYYCRLCTNYISALQYNWSSPIRQHSSHDISLQNQILNETECSVSWNSSPGTGTCSTV